jgi:beta-barrel assembly-enhancing protease
MANQMIQLKYGRQDESESDSTGIRYMADAGYDPREMLGVMQVLKRATEGRSGPEFMQSHPLPETRLAEIKQLVQKQFTPEQLSRLSKGRPLPGAGSGGRDGEKW